MEEKVKFFKALSDSNRLRIIKMLQTKPLCVCEITNVLGLATSTVSQHLKILKEAGFILEEKDGKWVNYLINPRPSDSRISSLLSSLDFWIADQSVIIDDKKRVLESDRNIICSK
jgi:ArsR family transcriptional regulator